MRLRGLKLESLLSLTPGLHWLARNPLEPQELIAHTHTMYGAAALRQGLPVSPWPFDAILLRTTSLPNFHSHAQRKPGIQSNTTQTSRRACPFVRIGRYPFTASLCKKPRQRSRASGWPGARPVLEEGSSNPLASSFEWSPQLLVAFRKE